MKLAKLNIESFEDGNNFMKMRDKIILIIMISKGHYSLSKPNLTENYTYTSLSLCQKPIQVTERELLWDLWTR